ncbi:MAG TPA: mechanosensitive ion channel family protein [Sphingomicrobium sp.]
MHLLRLILLVILFTPAAAQALPGVTDGNVESTAEASPPPQIELQSPDPEIAARLRGLFAELDGLDQVRAEVSGGVVTLSGLVLTAEDRQKAEAVASRLAGVVSVENDLVVEHRVGRRIQPMIAKARDVGSQIIAFLPLLLISLAVFLAIWLLGRLLTGSTWILQRVAPNPLVRTLIGQVIRLAFILVGLVLAMRIMGATALVGSVLGAAGVIGLAIGFAVRDTIENYIASILLSIRRPFAPNDHVIIEGTEGRVTRLNSRATFLTSLDGSEVRIPNAIVYKAKIINFTRIPERRFEFDVGIGYENDLCFALATALKAVGEPDGVLAKPEPTVLIDALDASTVSVKVLGWVDLTRSDFLKVRSAAIRAVKAAFDSEGVSMPAPIQNMRVLTEPEPEQGAATPPRHALEEAVDDTSADQTIEGKVEALRSGSGEDLLTTAAPRE